MKRILVQASTVAMAAAGMALGSFAGSATFNAPASSNGVIPYPGTAGNWQDGQLPERGDDVSIVSSTKTSDCFLNRLHNTDTNLYALGTVTADRANYVMQFCADALTAPTGISIYDGVGFRGWFRTIHPEIITFPATAGHTPVINRFEATGRARFDVPTAGTRAVISNLFGQGTVKYDVGAGELDVVRTSGDLLGMHRGSNGKLTLHSPVGAGADPADAAAVLAKAFSHFDAQNASTFTLEDDKVAEWRSPENAAIKAVPFVAQTKSPYQSYIPIPKPTYVADYLGTGKPVVDFGPWANTSRVDFATCGASALRIMKGSGDWRENAADVFVVFADNDEYARATIFNDSYNNTFVRGKANDTEVYNTSQTQRSHYGMLLRPYIQGRNALDFTVNGCIVPSTCSVSGPKLKVVSMRVDKTDNAQVGESRIGAMGRSGFDVWGGVVIGELVVFDKPLTEAERRTMIAYLKARWLAEDEQDESTVNEFMAYDNKLGVPEGETAVIRNYVNYGNKLLKEGGGTVAFGDVTKNALSVEVKDGNVGFSRHHDVSADPRPAPHAAFHFDATDYASFTFEEGTTTITRWQDQNDPTKAATPLEKVTDPAVVGSPAKPTYVADGLNGKPVVDFGEYRHLLQLQQSGFGTASALVFKDKTKNQYQTCREAFMVVRLINSGTPFGTDTGRQNLHCTGWNFIDSKYSEESVMGGSWAIDGLPLDGQSYPNTYDCKFVVLRGTFANGQFINAMALDRQNPGSLGGLKIGEAIYYDHALSDQERLDTEAYLLKKWFGKDHPRQAKPNLARVTYAEGLDAEIPSEGDATIGSLDLPSGKLTKTGTGTLSVGIVDQTSFAEVTVADGSLVLDEDVGVSNLFANAFLHFDATADSFVPMTVDECMDGYDNGIEQWNDVRGASVGYADHWSVYRRRPALVENAINGLRAVDFGQYGFCNADGKGDKGLCSNITAGAGMKFSKNLNAEYMEGFQVMKIRTESGSGIPIVAGTGSCNFHPDRTRIYNFPNNSHTNVISKSAWWVDDELVDAKTATRSGLGLYSDFHLVSFAVTGTVSQSSYPTVSAFAYERGQGCGGWVLGEAVYFDRALTPAERAAVRHHLIRKWLNGTASVRPIEKLSIGGNGSLRISDSVQARAVEAGGKFSGDCTVEDGGTLVATYAGQGSNGLVSDGTFVLPETGEVTVRLLAKPADGETYDVVTAKSLVGSSTGLTLKLVDADGNPYGRRSGVLSVVDGKSLRVTFRAPGMTILVK